MIISSKKHKTIGAFISGALCIFALSVVVIIMSMVRSENLDRQFNYGVKSNIQLIKHAILNRSLIIEDIRLLYKSSKFSDHLSFQDFANDTVDVYQDIELMAWVKKVDNKDIDSFASELSDICSDCDLEDVQKQEQGYGLFYKYVAPLEYKDKIGSGIHNLRKIKNIIKSNEQLDQIIFTSINYPNRDRASLLLMIPIYLNFGDNDINGYVLVVLNPEKFIRDAMDLLEYNVDVEIYDHNTEKNLVTLHDLHPKNAGKPFFSYGQVDEVVYPLRFLNNYWNIRVIPKDYDSYYTITWDMWVILIVGILVSVALISYTVLIIGRREDALETLHRRTDDLQLEKIKLDSILNAAGEGICGLDAEGRITFVNKVAHIMMNGKEKDVIGNLYYEIIHFSDKKGHESSPEYSPIMNEVLHKGNTYHIESYMISTHNSQIIPVYYKATPIINIYNEVEGAVLVIQDITNRKQIENEIKAHRDNLQESVVERTESLYLAKEEAEKALDEAREANNAKTLFLANMSHELRTPMHAVLGFSEIGIDIIETEMQDNSDNETYPQLIAFLSKIQASGNRLVTLLDNLLDLSKLEANKINLDYQDVSLSNVATDILDELSILLDEKNMSTNIKDNIDYKVECDSAAIKQVIINLLSNAIKFSDAGSTIVISIESSMIENTPATIFNVKDEGMGIPEGEEAQVFDKFIQSSKTRTGAGGTGLGLAICKEIIVLHGGNISVCNNDEVGATFSFIIPNNKPA